MKSIHRQFVTSLVPVGDPHWFGIQDDARHEGGHWKMMFQWIPVRDFDQRHVVFKEILHFFLWNIEWINIHIACLGIPWCLLYFVTWLFTSYQKAVWNWCHRIFTVHLFLYHQETRSKHVFLTLKMMVIRFRKTIKNQTWVLPLSEIIWINPSSLFE